MMLRRKGWRQIAIEVDDVEDIYPATFDGSSCSSMSIWNQVVPLKSALRYWHDLLSLSCQRRILMTIDER